MRRGWEERLVITALEAAFKHGNVTGTRSNITMLGSLDQAPDKTERALNAV